MTLVADVGCNAAVNSASPRKTNQAGCKLEPGILKITAQRPVKSHKPKPHSINSPPKRTTKHQNPHSSRPQNKQSPSVAETKPSSPRRLRWNPLYQSKGPRRRGAAPPDCAHAFPAAPTGAPLRSSSAARRRAGIGHGTLGDRPTRGPPKALRRPAHRRAETRPEEASAVPPSARSAEDGKHQRLTAN